LLLIILIALILLPVEGLPIPDIFRQTPTYDNYDYYDGSSYYRDPGRFVRELQKLYLQIQIIFRTTTTVATAPVTTAMPSVARSAAAIGAGTIAGVGAGVLIVAFVYTVLKIASLLTGGR
jgi:hypothetical protein